MAICKLDENKELKKALATYLNISIKNSLKENKPFKLLNVMRDINKLVYTDTQDMAKTLGIVAAVPGLFDKLTEQKPEYLAQLRKTGTKLDSINELKDEINSSSTPLQVVSKHLNITSAPTISSTINNSTSLAADAGTTVQKQAKTTSKYKDTKLVKDTYFASTIRTEVKNPDGTFEIDQKDPAKIATQNTVAALVMARAKLGNKNAALTYDDVTYDGHTGFRLKALIENTLPNPEKNAFIPDGYNLILAVTDKNGNFLYFDDNGKITTEDEGKIVYQYVQTIEPGKVKEKKDILLDMAKPDLVKQAAGDASLYAKLLAEEEKKINERINEEVKQIAQIKAKVQAGESVLLPITGGETGFVDDKNTSVTLGDMIEKGGLTDKEIDTIGDVTGYYNGIVVPGIQLSNYDQVITLKSRKMSESSPELINAIVDLLIDDLVDIEDNIVTPAEKKSIVKQFLEVKEPGKKTNDKSLLLSELPNNKLNIFIGGSNTPLSLDNKEEAKRTLKEFLNKTAYHTYIKRIGDTYTTFAIHNGVLSTKTEPGYKRYIAKYLIPRVMVDKATGTAMINNGYLTFSSKNLAEEVEEINKQTKETVKKAEDITGKQENKPLPDKDDPLPDLLERSKLIESRANKIQKKAADKWIEETPLLKIKVDGKPIITIEDLRNIVNSDAFATFSRSTMTLYKGGDSTHMYHEAWHAFSQVFLKKPQRDELYKNASKLDGSFTYISKVPGPGGNTNKKVTVKLNTLNPNNKADRRILEEFIAEEFRVYAMNNGKFKTKNTKASVFEKIFKAIWEFLKALFKGTHPVNVYSNPGSNVFAEMFNTLYTAKTDSDLNVFQPSIKNSEQFGTLNTGLVDKISDIDLDLLSKSMDGIISEAITSYIVDNKNLGAAMIIFNPKNLNAVYNKIVKGKFEKRLRELTAQQEANKEKWTPSQNDQAVKNIQLLKDALEYFGDIDTILKSKNPENSVVAYHLKNSAFSGRIKEAALDPTDRDNKWKELMANNDKSPNDFESSELATAGAKYIIESLVQQEYNADKTAVVNKLNELGFPQTVEFKPVWNFLMERVGGEQDEEDLYNKLVELKNKKITPLAGQLLDKLGSPVGVNEAGEAENVMTKSNIALHLWLGLVRSMNMPRIDFHNNIHNINITREEDENGEEVVIEKLTSLSGKVSADYFTIKNNTWKNKFQLDSSKYIEVNPTTHQNQLKLSLIVQEFLTDPTNPKERALTGNTLEFMLKSTDKDGNAIDPLSFLNAIGLYVPIDEELRNSLDPKAINSIANAIGYAAYNNHSVTDPVSYLDNAQRGAVMKLIGTEIKRVEGARTRSNATNVNRIAELSLQYSEDYSSQMKRLPSGDKKSTRSFNSTVTRILNALNKVNSINELDYDATKVAPNKYGIVPQYIYKRNPKVKGSIYAKSLFDATGARMKKNLVEIRELVGAQVRITDKGVATVEGISPGEMTRDEKFVNDLLSMLQTGYMEAVRNGEKSTYTAMRPNKIVTDDIYASTKKSNHLFFDTEDYLYDVNGLSVTGNTNVNIILNRVMMNKLEGELRVIQKLNNGITKEEAEALGIDPKDAKDFYKKHVKNFANGFKFDWFEEVLESIEDGDGLKKALINSYMDQLTPDNNLVDILLSTPEGKAFKKKIDAQILTYFRNVALRFKDIYAKIFAKDGVLTVPDFLRDLATRNLTDYQKNKQITDNAIIDALMMSFAVNSSLHTDEILTMIFGDGFQFNHNKDEGLKRVPTYHSPGIVFSTGNSAMAGISKFYPREYEKKLIEDGVITDRTAPRPFEKVGQKAIIKDPEVATLQYEIYGKLFKNTLSKRNYSETEVNDLLYGKGKTEKDEPAKGTIMHTWKHIQLADGQGHVSFDYYRMLKNNEDNWTNAQEIVYQKEIKGEYVSPEEIFDAFPVYKLQYAGSLALPGDMYPIQSIDKFSLLPLIPSLIKNTPLDIVHKEMIKQGVDYILFDSGAKRSYIKAGESNGDNIFEGNATGKLIPGFKFTKNPFFVDFLKNQTEVNAAAKNKSTLSTQFRKIFDTGLYEQGLPVDYKGSKESWNKLSDEQKEKESKIYKNTESVLKKLDRLTTYMEKALLKEMGWKRVGKKLQTLKGDEDLTEMLTYIKKKLKEQGYSQHEINSIETDNGKIDLSTSPIAPRLERFLFSLINNKLVKLKILGEPLVQVSSAFFGFTNATDAQLLEYGDNDFGLTGYVPDPNGKENTKGVKVKVALTKNYQNLYQTFYFAKDENGNYKNTGETIAVYNKDFTLNQEESFKRLNEMIKVEDWLADNNNREKIQITGVRIPVQGPNSTEFAQIHEFLPPSAGTIIIIPREIVAKSGGDFDVDKLTMYIKYITKQGSLLLDTVNHPKDLDKKIDELEEKLGTLNGKKLNINNHIADFRKAIEEVKDRVEMSKEQVEAFTNEDGKALLDTLSNEGNQTYLAQVAPEAYEIFNKKLKSFDTKEWETVQKAIIDLRNKNSELAKVYNKLSDLKDHKRNFIAAIQNSMLGDFIKVLEMPETAFSLLLPNGTYLAKPQADDLQKVISKVDNEVDYNKSINTGKPIAGREVGVNPGTLRDYSYNLKKQQDFIAGKRILGPIVLEIPIHAQLNKAGALLQSEIKEKIPGPKRKLIEVTTPITLELRHNFVDVGTATKEIRRISMSNILDAEKKNQIADVLSQLANGAVDVGKDAWIAYLQGNLEAIPKLLFLLETGVPATDAFYFMNNPLIREYVALKQRAGSRLAKLFFGSKHNKKNMIDEFIDSKLKKNKGVNEQAYNNLDTYWGTYNFMKSFIDNLGLKAFDQDSLIKIANGKGTEDEVMAGFLQYLYVEKLTRPHDDLKRAIDVDNNTTGDNAETQAKLEQIENLQDLPIYDEQTLDYLINHSVISSFFIQEMSSDLFGERLFDFRANKEINTFIRRTLEDYDERTKLQKLGLSKENFPARFKNALTLHLFTNALAGFNLKEVLEKGYNGHSVNELLEGTKVGTIDQIKSDYNNRLYLYNNRSSESYVKRGLYPINIQNLKGLTENDFIKLTLEREYLRKVIMPFSPLLKSSNEFGSIMKRFDKQIEPDMQIDGWATLPIEDKENIAYEYMILHQALLNTYNNHEMFSSGENTVSAKLFNIIHNYPELSTKYNHLITRFAPDILKSTDKLNLRRNFLLKANSDISDAAVSQYYKDWTELADPKHKLDKSEPKDIAANKYISDFFSKLPLYAFLQSGLDPSKFSMNTVFPRDNFQPIMDGAIQKFKQDVLSESQAVNTVLNKFLTLFKANSESPELRVRGIDYKKELYASKESPEAVFVEEGPEKESLLTYEERKAFKAAVDKNKGMLPKEYFTKPDSKWILNINNLYDLVDQKTGEIYVPNIDLETGFPGIPGKPIIVEDTPVKGELAMQPHNIELINQGIKTLTARTYKIGDGTYTLPDGSKVSVKYIGKAAVVTTEGMEQIAFLEGNPTDYFPYRELDAFAKAEGFADWADFKKNAMFSESFINGKASRYIYSVKPFGEVKPRPRLLKNENGLIIAENIISKPDTIKIVEQAKDLIEETSIKQTAGAVSWGYGMQWMRINAMSPKQREGLVVGKQLNGANITPAMKADFIKTGNTKGFPLYGYTTIDKNGKTLPAIPKDLVDYLASIGIDVSKYDASYNSVYDIADNGSLIIHQDNTETNLSPIITISLGRPMKFVTYELNDPNDFNVADSNNTAFRIAVNAVQGEALKLNLIPASAKDKTGKVKYGHFTPDTLLKYAEQIDQAQGTQLKQLVMDKLKEQFKNAEKTEYDLKNGAVLVFSGNNRNVLHEIVFDPETNKKPMESGFPTLTVNKAFKGLGQEDKMVDTNNYRIVLTLRKVLGDTATDVVDQQKLIGSLSQPTTKPVVEEIKEEPSTKDTPVFDSLPGKSDIPTMTYAGIGSRQTPQDVLDVMTKASTHLESLGYTLRSGGAEGADLAFEKGVKSKKQIFSGFTKTGDREKAIAHEIHPNLKGVMEGAKKRAIQKGKNGDRSAWAVENLMARNTNQVFGEKLDTPVDFVLAYDPSGWTGKGPRPSKGGTLQAIDMAARKGIPVINMANKDWRDELKAVLQDIKARKEAKPTTQPTVQPRTFKDEEYHQAYIKGGLQAVQDLIQKNKQKELTAAKQLSKEVDMLTEFEDLNVKPNKTNSDNDRLIELYVMLKNSKELDFEYSLNQLGLSTQPTVQAEVKEEVKLPNDQYKYYGKMYEIVRDAEGKGIDVVGYKGKTANKEALLVAYNNNPNIDPQNGKPFRQDILAQEKEKFEQTVPEKKEDKRYELFPGVYANEGQKIAIDKIEEFLGSKDDEFLLKGRGGTGKTTIIKKALENLPKNLVIGATVAYDAKEVLQENMHGYRTSTIASLLGLIADYDSKTGELYFRQRDEEEEAFFRAAGKSDLIEGKKYIIIDEASMISPFLYNQIMEKKDKNAKVIFMGDNVQIPSIDDESGGSIKSPIWKLVDSKNFAELSERMRQGEESPILPITDLYAENVERMQQGLSGVKNPLVERNTNFDGKEGVLFLTSEKVMIDSFIEDIKNSDNLKEAIIISARNTVADRINDEVRQKLFNTKEPYTIGDRIRVNSPYVVNGAVLLPNGFKGKVINVEKSGYSVPGLEDLDTYDLTLSYTETNSDGKVIQKTKKLTTISPKDKLKLKAAVNKLAVVAMSFPKRSVNAIKAWKEFYNLKNGIVDIGYNYAITDHKVQGSTYNSAYVLEDDIMSFPGGNELVNQMMYTAVSRPRKKLVIFSPLQNVIKPESVKPTPTPAVTPTVSSLPTQPVVSDELAKRKKVILNSWKKEGMAELLAARDYDINDFIAKLEAAQTVAEIMAIVNQLRNKLC